MGSPISKPEKGMRIYYYSTRGQVSETDYQILKLLKANGVEVFSNLEVADPVELIKKSQETGEPLLNQMDGVIIEGGMVSYQTGYLVAYSIANRKPVLFLLERGRTPDEALKSLEQNKTSSRYFSLEFYLPGHIEKLAKNFLKRAEVISGVDAPMLKFTFRITAKIDNYLQFKTQNTSLSKADFLRKILIEQIIQKDQEYQKFIG